MPNLFIGMTGSDVEKLQQKLQELGFYSGPIDGLFGQGVEQAVKDYEDSRLLPLINSLWLFGLCYAMDEVYKRCNPYIERHLAIFVNYFRSRAN
jgi:hypothetical protein